MVTFFWFNYEYIIYTDVDDLVLGWMNKVTGRSEGELTRWNDERKLANGETLVGGYVAPPLIIFRPEMNNYAGPEATEAMRAIGGKYHNPNIPDELFQSCAAYELPSLVVKPPRDADIGYVQGWYDSVITTNAENNVTQDQLIYESSDLTIPIYDTLRIEPLKPGYKLKSYSKMTPVLKTIMPSNLVQSQVTTLLCLSKRTANVPNLRNTDINSVTASKYFFQNFVKSCLRDDFDRCEAFDTIEPNAHLLQLWLDKQPPSVRKMIESQVALEERNFSLYEFMVKGKLKPPLESNAVYKIPGGQTICYHSKEINAVVCPIFSVARDRLVSILKPNIMIMTGMSNDEFEKRINQCFDIPSLWRETNKVENDFSKYDKSQHETLLRFEIKLYALLGVPKYLLDIWYESHRRSTLRDKMNGVRMETEFQRKSGDAVTFLGNTVCLLAAMSASFDFRHMRLGLFAGDDSLLFIEKYYPTYDATSALADWLNLESKLLDQYQYPYFCSKFLVCVEGRLYLIPDILRTLTKLGRTDFVNHEHVEEYRVSLCDSLVALSNMLLHGPLAEALQERYKIYSDSEKVMRVLNTYIQDPALFGTLYFANDESSLMKGPNRPSLD